MSWHTVNDGFLILGAALCAALAAALASRAALRRCLRQSEADLASAKAETRGMTEAFQRAEAFSQSLLEYFPHNFWRKDLAGRYTFANEVFARTVGQPLDHIIGRMDQDLFPPERARRYRDADAQILAHGQPRETIEEDQNATGERIYVRIIRSPLYDPERRPTGVQAVFWDISARKAVEAELAYERDLFRTLLDNLPDSIYFKDLESRFVRVGRAKVVRNLEMARNIHRLKQPAPTQGDPWPPHLASLEAFAGYIIGKTDFDFFSEDRAREALADEQAILRTGQPLLGKLEKLCRLDGKMTWCLTTKMVWLDKDGRRIGTFGISTDVTSLKEAEAKLEAAGKQLLETSRQAGMAEVATSVLHNVGNVLNSANVSANILSAKLRQLELGSLARVARLLQEHQADLSSFLKEDAKGRQLAPYVAQLAEHLEEEQSAALQELNDLVNHLEHIKEIVARQQSFSRVSGVIEKLPVAELVEDALRLNAAALEREEVCVERHYEPALPEIVVERHKVLQILVNLVRNAKYACDEAPGADKKVSVRVANGSGRIKISVTDNGVGIAPENLTRIFTHGFTTRKNGHGFGLHSGALAARELGGSLLAHSAGLGLGATFTLELPLAPPAHDSLD